MNVNKVLYNIDQTGDTSASQKETARKNIGATKVETSTSTLPPVASAVSTLTIKDNGRIIGDSGTLGVIALEPGQSDAGKILKAQWTGSPGIGTAIWDDQWPAGGTQGQALILDAQGNPVWSSINEVPNNGANGQVLTWNNNAYSWQNRAMTWKPGYNLTGRADPNDTLTPYMDSNYVVKNSYAIINSADGQAGGPDITHETELECGIVFEIKYWSRSSTADENMLTFRIKHKTGVNLVVSGSYTNYSATVPDNMSVYANVVTADTYTDIIAHGLSDTSIFFANNPNSTTNVAETLKLKASWTNTKHYVQFSDIEIWRGIGGTARILYTYTTLTNSTGE